MSKNISQDNAQQSYRFNQSHYFLFFLIFLSIFACYKLLQPYLTTLALATILSIVLHPVYRKLNQWVRGRKNLAALLTCLLLTLVIVLPLMFVMIVLIQQGIQSFTAIYNWIASGEYQHVIDHPWTKKIIAFGDTHLPEIQRVFPEFDPKTLRLDQMLLRGISSLGKRLIDQGGSLFGNVTALLGNFFLLLFAFFFILRDQDRMFKAILHLIPLSASYENKIITKVRVVARSALLGTLITAIAQGIAGGFAFYLAGLPGLFWGAMMAFASLIPLIGTSLIWVPAASYLLLSGRWGYGVFMALWCALFVGTLDNFIRPLFMKEAGGNTSTLLIFLAILGGINTFGLVGVLFGPLILGLTLVLLYIYSLEFKSFLTSQDRS